MTQQATPIAQKAPPETEAPRSLQPKPGQKPKEYETIYILRSDVDADGAERVQTRVVEVVDRAKGKLVKVEAWGRRRLAYPVAKQRRGVYVYVKYIGAGGLVQELERNLKLQDMVLKFQTVKLRDDVDVGALTIDPEEVKLGRLELPPEEEKEESREKVLGLVDFGEGAPARPRRDDEDEFADEELPPESSREAPPAAEPVAEEKKEEEPS
jgi:small subunit ribosomal protein S6